MAFSGYNKSYQAEYDRRSATPLADKIYECRWDLVRRFCDGGSLLDYGCANGAFHTRVPHNFTACGWDINPSSEYSGPQPKGMFDILTFWDVIEHLTSPFSTIVQYQPKYVFISTPNAANTDLESFVGWKHFKPIEHLFYFTPLTLSMSMKSIGYKHCRVEYEEGKLRDADNPEAIFSAVFKKCGITLK